MTTIRKLSSVLVLIVLVGFSAVAVAEPLPGRDVLKFSQRPMDNTPVDGGIYFGHDNISSIEGDHTTGVYGSATGVYGPGTFAADDFADNFDTSVVHIKWWGSYPVPYDNGGAGVQRFLISFETDVPVDPLDASSFSHPGAPILTQVLDRGVLSPQSGTFTEVIVGSNPIERMTEYNGELKVPFQQQADTVYWLKIVALIDPVLDNTPGKDINWGWHSRDYTQQNLLASAIPIPGENNQGPGPFSDPLTEIWHFQDDAVTGAIDNVDLGGGVPSGVPMDQDLSTFQATYYWDDIDGIAGISAFSQDLAFELYTTIPEPATMSLLCLGGLGVLARRRSKKVRRSEQR